jgi:hypothetical protein
MGAVQGFGIGGKMQNAFQGFGGGGGNGYQLPTMTGDPYAGKATYGFG